MARGSTAASAYRSSKQRRSKTHRKQPRTADLFDLVDKRLQVKRIPKD